MKHYDYDQTLKKIWEKAVDLYRKGQSDSSEFFEEEEVRFLESIGITSNEVFDFVEDFVDDGEPGFAVFAMIHDIRRSYFREIQKGHLSPQTLLPGDLPARAAEAAGIQWLPRIIAKAKAKLRGELDADIMYCCGGDRHFLKQVDIHPAEFLRMIKDHETDEQAIIDWVTQRAPR